MMSPFVYILYAGSQPANKCEYEARKIGIYAQPYQSYLTSSSASTSPAEASSRASMYTHNYTQQVNTRT